MPRRVELPPSLIEHPFSIAEGRQAGVGGERLRSADLLRPHAGVRVHTSHADAAPDTVLARCAAYAPLLRRGQFFSHVTAAQLWGCPVSEEKADIHVSASTPARAPRRPGIAGHHAARATVLIRNGLPVSDPVSTWIALGALLPLDELVVAGDHLVLDPFVLDPRDVRPYATIAEVDRAVREFSGRGARACAAALRLIRVGAESRPETLLRLLLWRAGFPEPALNIQLTDAAGRTLGRGDLVYPLWRTVVEYDGDQHRTDTRQYDRDITRIDSFVNAGWRVVRVRKRGLFFAPRDTIARVEHALRAGGWRG